ncbi:MAG TPA: right-handed parallel beta-helix repeat-containing protein [Verrucomicrobiae bacterium]|nr:right-handed parallel beta-helix repeat-containing protein [Verrucomicrobiae bacterium]
MAVAAGTIATLGSSQDAYAATFTVTNTNDAGAGSLRQALIDSNANAGVDTITFNIPGAGPHVISPLTSYSITDNSHLGSGMDGSNAVIVDGCSQPGSDCSKFPLTIKVQVDAANLPVVANSGIFNPAGVGSTVKGLSITGGAAKGYSAFSQIRIAYNGRFVCLGGYTLQSNFIGIAPDGSANGNVSGLAPCTSATAAYPTRVGGPNPGEGNVIGSNSNFGVATNIPVFGAGQTNGWIIEGNYFGLDPTGTQSRPNSGGSVVSGADIAVSGAYTHPTSGVKGVIIRNNKLANSSKHGMYLYRSSGMTIENNEIKNSTIAGIYVLGSGITTDGTGNPPNIVQTPSVIQNNTIAGTTAGPGVAVVNSGSFMPTRVTIQKNSIFDNSGLAIDLSNDDVTDNGPAGTLRTGPNNLINYPEITKLAHGSLVVDGTYAGMPNETYTLDFYASETGHSSGYGSGQTWVGADTVTTDASGNATFHFTLSSTVQPDWVVSATATDTLGNTSEFSSSLVMPETPTPLDPDTPPGQPAPLDPGSTPPGELANTGQSTTLVIVLASLLITGSAVVMTKPVRKFFGRI